MKKPRAAKDTERLDWLCYREDRAAYFVHGPGGGWVAREYDADISERQYKGNTLRQALDAAIAAMKSASPRRKRGR